MKLYMGKVSKVAGSKLHVVVPELGGSNYEFGPLPAVSERYKDKYQVDTDPGGGAIIDNVRYTYYEPGDAVVVGQLGVVKEELVVLGRIG